VALEERLVSTHGVRSFFLKVPGKPMAIYYRFRSIENLLGEHQELENQSVFFASPENLNDPVEGFRDIYWHGDLIVWNNLFRHYLICLTAAFAWLATKGETEQITFHELPIFTDGSAFSSLEFRTTFEEIHAHFLSRPVVTEFIRAIGASDRKVRRGELQFYLQNLHLPAIDSIAAIIDPTGALSAHPRSGPAPETALQNLLAGGFGRLLKSIGPEFANVALESHAFLMSQILFEQRYRSRSHWRDANRSLVLLNFPSEYVRAVEPLLFPQWYTACFMSECENSAIWGHYGNEHRGVCLIFESQKEGDRDCLALDGIHGESINGPERSIVPVEFRRIDYADGLAEIDFYRSIGQLSAAALNSMWYGDQRGHLSVCAQDMLSDQTSWRERYWKSFYRDILRKTKDWEYEHEYRLIVSEGGSSIYKDDKSRAMRYDFHSLKGLIFGINTSIEDKLTVLEIIERKCAAIRRNDFQFFQATYSPSERRIKHQPLSWRFQ
jgi:Protein of unknown function (DUF2971)